MTIHFYAAEDSFGELSNFFKCSFDLNGKKWSTVEHYFQSQKFNDPLYQEKIRLAKTPHDALRLGRTRKIPIRSDWDVVKDDVMRSAVMAKFSSHTDLRKFLLSTGDVQLIEATTRDHYWGEGSSGNGKNMLGVILMEVRQTIMDRA